MGFIGEIDFSLQQAISQGKLRGVKSSLAEGADLRIGSFLFGVTPLQAAIQLGHQDIVLALMNHAYAQGNIGVLIAAVDYLGQNVAHYAAASPDPGMYAIVAAALVANGRLDLLQLVSYAGLTPLQAKYGLDRQKAES